MDVEEVREGRIRLRVPEASRRERGPGAHEAEVFYNPAMRFNRDLSVVVAHAALSTGARVLDGLAASGARGLRFGAEVPLDLRVELNDWNPAASQLIQENAKFNGLSVEVHQRNLAALLWQHVWDWVDVDPFGSPAPFVDGATRAVFRRGVLAVTATDATALAGVYPDVCQRRYLARPMRGELQHEVALRILAGFVARQGAKHDVAFTPALAHATDHYYRVYARCERGANAANRALAQIGHAWLCDACAARAFAPGAPSACEACGARVKSAGPLWTGSLYDPALVARALALVPEHADLADAGEVARQLETFREEAEAPALFFDLARMSSRAGVGQPSRERVVARLREEGFGAWRTHVTPQGVRTRAQAADVVRIIRDLSARA